MTTPPTDPPPPEPGAGVPPNARASGSAGAPRAAPRAQGSTRDVSVGDLLAAEAEVARALERVSRVLGQALARGRAAVGADYAAIALTAPGGGDLAWRAVEGASPVAWDAAVFPLARQLATRATATSAPIVVVVPPPAAGSAPTPTAPPERERVRAAVAVPVAALGERPIGALVLGWRSAGGIGAAEVSAAENAAAESWPALENSRLLQRAGDALRTAEAARRRSDQADRERSMFLATMSHEIRTPLNAVLGYAELLELEIDGPLNEAQRERLASLRRTGRHLLNLVTGILDVAKVEAGEMRVQRQPTDLREILPVAFGAVAPQAAAGGVSVVDRTSADASTYYVGDADRVAQILVNLLSNAVKFTLPNGRVTVQCSTVVSPDIETALAGPGPWLRVDVVDTGVGIAPERLPYVFDAFVQGHAMHERIAGGTGLGLTISRRLARLMGGDLTVVSAPGRGSRFTLWLPTD